MPMARAAEREAVSVAGTNGRPGMVSYGKVGMSRGRVVDGGWVVGGGGGASDVGGGGGGASLVAGGGGGAWVCVTVPGARVIVCVTGGGACARRLLRWRRFRRRRRCCRRGRRGLGVVVVTVVDAGDGVLSSLRSTNHTATAIAARTRDQAGDQQSHRAAPAPPHTARFPVQTEFADADHPRHRCRPRPDSRTDRWGRRRECRRPRTRPEPGRC